MNNDQMIRGKFTMKKIKNILIRRREEEEFLEDQQFQSKRYKSGKDQTSEYDMYEDQIFIRNRRECCMREILNIECKREILQREDGTKFTKKNILRNNVKIIDCDIKKINKRTNKNECVKEIMTFGKSINLQNDHFVGGTCINKHLKGDDAINQRNNKEVQKRCKQEEMNRQRVCKRYKKDERGRKSRKQNTSLGSLLTRRNSRVDLSFIQRTRTPLSSSPHEHVYDVLGIFNSQSYLRLKDDSLYFIYKSYRMMDSILYSSFLSKMSEFNFINILFGYKIFKNYMMCPSVERGSCDLLFLVSCLIASKYLDDKHIINCWIPERLVVLNMLEMKILSTLKYTIELDEYNLYDLMNEIFPPK